MTVEESTQFNAPHNNDKNRSYKRAVTTLTTIGSEVFGIEISYEQKEFWQAMFTGMHYLDDILDSQERAEVRLSEFDHGIRFLVSGDQHHSLNSDLIDVLQSLREIILATDETQLPMFAREAHNIALLGERLRCAKDAHSLGIITLAEGRVTSRLLAIPEVGPDQEKIAEFNKLFSLIGAYGNVVDALFDLRHDAAEDRLLLSPSLGNHIRLARVALPGVVSIGRSINGPALIKLSASTIGAFANRRK